MRKLLMTLGLVATPVLFAQNGARLGEPTFGGNACNRGSARAVLSTDGQAVSILFDDYIAEAGGDSNRRQEKRNCKIAIPVIVPPGHSAAVFKVDYRGFNALPAGAQSEFSVDYFFGGRVGPRYTQNFRGPLEDDFASHHDLNPQDVVWSACGRSLELRAHSALTVTTNRPREQSFATIDSADVQAGLVYHLVWKRCTR